MPEEVSLEQLRRAIETELKREKRVRTVDALQWITDLKQRYQDLARPTKFNSGDIVRWKNKLKNKKRPAYDEPAIVIDVLKQPTIDPEAEGGSTYFREPLDIILGLIDEDGEFSFFHYDHRRFELWESKGRTRAPKVRAEGKHGS